jgi:hypothetical protein
MSEFDVLLEYVLPISKKNGIIQLVLSDEIYKDGYLSYALPTSELTTLLTSESGDVEISISFLKAELDYEGNTIERVRNCANPAILKIIPLSSWFHASDQALSDLASIYIENKKLAMANLEAANLLSSSKVDGIVVSDDSIYLTSNGEVVGEKLDLKELNEKLVSVGGETTGNISILRI